MSDPKTTFRSALWNHAGRILEYILMYLTSILIARGLGVQENGIFVGLFSISQLLLVLTSLGLEVSLNKHIPQLRDDSKGGHLRYILRRALATRVVVVSCFAFVLYSALHLFPTVFPPLLVEYIWLLVAYSGIRSIASLFTVVMTAELQTRATSIINVLTRVVEITLIGSMISGGISTTSVFFVLLAAAALQVAAYVVVARTHLRGKEVRIAVIPIIMFGGIYWANNLMEYFLGRQGDVLLLTTILADPAQVSLYDVAFAVSQLASLSMTVGLGGITLATSAKLALQESGALERFYGFMIRMTSLLTIPLYAFMLFNASSVLSVLYSSRYLAAAGLVQGIAAFRITSRLFGGPENAEFLLSRSQVSKLVGIGIIGAIVNVGLDVLLIPKFGATGAVVGSGCGNVMVNLLGAMAVYRISSAQLQWKFWLKIVLSSSVASLFSSMLITTNNITFIVLQVIGYVLLTFLLFTLLKPLTHGDGEWLTRIDTRLAPVWRLLVGRNQSIPSAEPI